MIYAGIGSRGTPYCHIQTMRSIGHNMAMAGHTLRSGGAVGADTAYELGARMVPNASIEIYRPVNIKIEWLTHASCFHPAWGKCDQYARALHARNSAIMLGPNLDSPVDFVSCWTQNGQITGGTGQALRIAKIMNIPVYNLFDFPNGGFPDER